MCINSVSCNVFYCNTCTFCCLIFPFVITCVSNVAVQVQFDNEPLRDTIYDYRRLNDVEMNMFPGVRYK